MNRETAPPPCVCLQAVSGTVTVVTDDSQDEVDALAHQVHLRCPIASMMRASGCRLDIQWVRGGPGGKM